MVNKGEAAGVLTGSLTIQQWWAKLCFGAYLVATHTQTHFACALMSVSVSVWLTLFQTNLLFKEPALHMCVCMRQRNAASPAIYQHS